MFLFQPDFGALVRTLTNLGALATNAVVTSTAIAGAATVDLRPGLGLTQLITMTISTGAAATGACNIQGWDGGNAFTVAATAAAANASIGFHGVNGHSVGFRLSNADATHAGTYMTSSFQFTN